MTLWPWQWFLFQKYPFWTLLMPGANLMLQKRIFFGSILRCSCIDKYLFKNTNLYICILSEKKHIKRLYKSLLTKLLLLTAGADLEGVGWGGGIWTPPYWNFQNIHHGKQPYKTWQWKWKMYGAYIRKCIARPSGGHSGSNTGGGGGGVESR